MDELLDKAGGFGKFQWFTSVVMIIVFSLGGMLSYALVYLELVPLLTCWNGEERAKCDTDEACLNGAFVPAKEVEKNMDSHYSLDTWVESMDMYCWSGFKIGFIGSAYFIGMAICGLLFKLFSDKFGRKWTIFAGIWVVTIGISGTIFINNVYWKYFFMFVAGIGSFRSWAGYILLCELCPS